MLCLLFLIVCLLLCSVCLAFRDPAAHSRLPEGLKQLLPSGNDGSVDAPLSDNLSRHPALKGGEIRFLKNMGSVRHQLSCIVKSRDGRLLVVDGGQADDVPHLLDTLKTMNNGHVDAWLITHPQTDHVSALYTILADHPDALTIDRIFYHFQPLSWYQTEDPDESGMVWLLTEQLKSFPADRQFPGLLRGDHISLSPDLSFSVLNSPVLTTGPYASNSSGTMYDIAVDGRHLIILGDMGAEVGTALLNEGVFSGLQVDYLQMAHHGQDGVGEDVYRALKPRACIWPAPDWIYYPETNDLGLKTEDTKSWIRKLGVSENYVTLDSDVVIH